MEADLPLPVELLTEQVHGLPSEQRRELLDRVVESLDPTPLDAEWERAWAEEADRREAEIAAGRAQRVSGAQALASARGRDR